MNKGLVSFIYKMYVVPVVYSAVEYIFLSLGMALFTGDLLRGFGIMAAVALFYIAKNNYIKIMTQGMFNNVESDEAEGV